MDQSANSNRAAVPPPRIDESAKRLLSILEESSLEAFNGLFNRLANAEAEVGLLSIEARGILYLAMIWAALLEDKRVYIDSIVYRANTVIRREDQRFAVTVRCAQHIKELNYAGIYEIFQLNWREEVSPIVGLLVEHVQAKFRNDQISRVISSISAIPRSQLDIMICTGGETDENVVNLLKTSTSVPVDISVKDGIVYVSGPAITAPAATAADTSAVETAKTRLDQLMKIATFLEEKALDV